MSGTDPAFTDPAFAEIAHHSAQDVLAHQRFAAARMDYVDAALALYQGDAFLTRLLVEAARHVVFTMIVCLDAGTDPDDPATWATLAVLKQQMAQYGLSSPRRIESLVALLVHNGFLQSIPSARDGRRRVLKPTAKMLSTDQDWLAASYLPLHVMFPDPGFGAVMRREATFHRALRRVATGFFGRGAQILGGNPDIMLFLERDAGILILLRLVQMAGAPDGRAVELDCARTGARFGISRTHVQKILQDAARAGLVGLSGRGGRLVTLSPRVWRALDRFLAESMSGHDMLFNLASRQVGRTIRAAS